MFLLVVSMLFCVAVQAQESTTDKAVRVYVGYKAVVADETHYGPAIYFSIPANTLKIRIGFFGRSLAWSQYESRGGFIHLSKLINNPESSIRFRINLEATYSAENLVGSSQLPHKLITVTGGGSVIFTPVTNFNIEISSGVGYGSLLTLPVGELLDQKKAGVALSLGFGVSYFF